MPSPSPSPQPVRIREIAAKAKCTIATVSMALNGSERLPEKTRIRIQAIARKLGYVPNRLAKSLSLGRTGVLGVVLPMASDPYYAAILDALNQEALSDNRQLLFQFHHWSPQQEDKALQRLAESRVDGILLYPARRDYAGAEVAEWLAATRMPLVMLSDIGGESLSFAAGRVMKDRQAECTLIRQELLRLNHRRADLLHPHFSRSEIGERYEGLLDREDPQNAGLDLRLFRLPKSEGMPISPKRGFSPAESEQETECYLAAYLDWPERGSAVVTSNHSVAWKLMALMRKRNLRVPEDLSMISIGILKGGEGGGFPLTAVEYDARAIARLALGMARDRLDDLRTTGMIPVQPQLCSRGSAIPFSGNRP